MIQAWSNQRARMETEDWIYVGLVFLACVWGFWLGIFLGWLLLKMS